MKDTRFDIYIGNVFKTIREGRRLTLVEVADAINMSNQRLSNYEFGKRSLSIPEFKLLCDFYKVDPMTILDEAYENTREEKNEQIQEGDICLTES